ncbi:hypothetical protein QQS21_004870 [Conoideocrella luteorostrata]|uniref:Uncharacterized protein n=1 Tax=Conoideocrella luteorostrata TaxID=1105319 RepID=A0AAJ0CQH8_9HYPO|nr:hypothetical protein QQS21_004870 [Conoideocrella luteorostrata]
MGMATTERLPSFTAVDIDTYLPYLVRDELYDKEKPYGADFPVDHFKDSKLSNHEFEKFPMVIRDAQPVRHSFNLDTNGFCFLRADTSITPDLASNAQTPALTKYLQEIEKLLYHKFPEYARIEVMDFQVRKRAEGFPTAVGTRVEYEQPAAMPHTDFSVEGAFMRMCEAFPGQEKHYESKSFDLINVWRVLIGPNDDWPLAVCDFQSVDIKRDVLRNDCLHQTRVGENWLLMGHESHRWFYLSHQQPNDLIVFRNTDSEGMRASK